MPAGAKPPYTVVLLALAALAPMARADWKVTTALTSPFGSTSTTEYFRGALHRIDSRDFVSIVDSDRMRQTAWNTRTRQYWVHRVRPGHVPAPPPSGSVVSIDLETTDTGERRPIFGRTARHLVTVERRGAAESRIDGWYVDADSLPPALRAGGHVAVLSAGGAPPVLLVTHKGPRLSGLPVFEKTIAPDGREFTREVTELYEGPLDPALFRPPPGFEWVPSMPDRLPASWFDRALTWWDWLLEWLP